MELAIVDDRPLLTALLNHCKFCRNCDHLNACRRYQAAWVGGKRVLSANFYAWSNGLVIDKGDQKWLRYSDGTLQPEPHYNGECLEIVIWKTKSGLNDEVCSELRT